MDLLHALLSPDMPFLRNAFIAGILASVAFGISGSIVVVNRISYLAGAIAHSVLAGIGISLYLQKVHAVTWLSPQLGSVVSALLSALVIGTINLKSKERADTVIGAIWSLGMATGIIFLAMTPGFNDAMSYMFGNILLITSVDLWIIVLIDIFIAGIILCFFNYFVALSFDEQYAKIRGVNTDALHIILLCLIALAVVMFVAIVGIVMVIALLTLPAAIAGKITKNLKTMMLVATLLCVGFTTSGLTVSYYVDLPAGPIIILIAGAVYLTSHLFPRSGKTRKA